MAMVIVYFQDKNFVHLFLWCSFSSLKLQIDFSISLRHSCFFITLENIKYKKNLVASSDFAVTGKGMIIYTVN